MGSLTHLVVWTSLPWNLHMQLWCIIVCAVDQMRYTCLHNSCPCSMVMWGSYQVFVSNIISLGYSGTQLSYTQTL